MKKTILFLFVILFTGIGYAQTTINYKGLVSKNGSPYQGTIKVKVSIYDKWTFPAPGISLLWKEEHSSVTTDDNGIFSIAIGAGTKIAGSAAHFIDINWSVGLFAWKVYSIDIDAGDGYVNLVDKKPFRSVPSANYAIHAGILDPTYNEVIIKNYGTSTHGITIEKKGKLKATASGNSDMKAYIYGRVKFNGVITSSASSGGFTATRLGTGKYKITFTDTSIATNKYIVVVTAWAASEPENVTYESKDGYINIYSWDLSGNPKNTAFDFVVFKK